MTDFNPAKAAKAIRDAAIENQPTVEVSTDGLFNVMGALSAACHDAIGAKAEGDGVGMALSYGRVDGILATLAMLGLPAPADSAGELLDQAEALLALPEDEAQELLREALTAPDEG